jgi:hypothetical protein
MGETNPVSPWCLCVRSGAVSYDVGVCCQRATVLCLSQPLLVSIGWKLCVGHRRHQLPSAGCQVRPRCPLLRCTHGRSVPFSVIISHDFITTRKAVGCAATAPRCVRCHRSWRPIQVVCTHCRLRHGTLSTLVLTRGLHPSPGQCVITFCVSDDQVELNIVVRGFDGKGVLLSS